MGPQTLKRGYGALGPGWDPQGAPIRHFAVGDFVGSLSKFRHRSASIGRSRGVEDNLAALPSEPVRWSKRGGFLTRWLSIVAVRGVAGAVTY